MRRSLVTGSLSLLTILGAPALAATIVVNPNPPTVVPGIQDHATGADLRGLVVTATYGDVNGPQTLSATWASTGLSSGSATDSLNFSVSINGDASAPFAWQYSSLRLDPLESLELDGTAAGIYFDRAHSGPGTPGSGPGADLTLSPLIGGNSPITITYTSAVQLKGQSPQNDLYAKVTVDFSGLQPLGGLEPQDFQFSQPTDLRLAPEPGTWTMLLMAAALFGAVCKLRMQRRPTRCQ